MRRNDTKDVYGDVFMGMKERRESGFELVGWMSILGTRGFWFLVDSSLLFSGILFGVKFNS